MCPIRAIDPIIVAEATPEPRDIIRHAIAWMRALSVRVLPSVDWHGVRYVPGDAQIPWVRARRFGDVSPIGAAILCAQPDVEDLESAAAVALGGSIPLAEGLADGLARVPPSTTYGDGPSAFRYAEGYALGGQVRVELMTAVCGLHNRRFSVGVRCPDCRAAEVAARAAAAEDEEVTVDAPAFTWDRAVEIMSGPLRHTDGSPALSPEQEKAIQSWDAARPGARR